MSTICFGSPSGTADLHGVEHARLWHLVKCAGRLGNAGYGFSLGCGVSGVFLRLPLVATRGRAA